MGLFSKKETPPSQTDREAEEEKERRERLERQKEIGDQLREVVESAIKRNEKLSLIHI